VFSAEPVRTASRQVRRDRWVHLAPLGRSSASTVSSTRAGVARNGVVPRAGNRLFPGIRGFPASLRRLPQAGTGAAGIGQAGTAQAGTAVPGTAQAGTGAADTAPGIALGPAAAPVREWADCSHDRLGKAAKATAPRAARTRVPAQARTGRQSARKSRRHLAALPSSRADAWLSPFRLADPQPPDGLPVPTVVRRSPRHGFEAQSMQRRAAGFASSRAGAICLPQRSQRP
jgi:hypothetical protein